MSKEKEPKEREGTREAYLLAVPSEEHHRLDFKVEFIKEEEGTKWIRLTAIVNNIKTIAWWEWPRESKDKET